MKKTEKIILEKDVILPPKETIEVYNLGTAQAPQYIVSEKTALYTLMTHKICENCGNIVGKNSYCRPCSEKRQNENYLKKEFREWDGETPLVIYNSDFYLFDLDDLTECIAENGIIGLQLMICEPNYCPELSEEYFAEEFLPENYDSLVEFDEGLVLKIKELNEYIRTLKPISWTEGKYRTEYKM
jgi:RNA polymerase subunit RPABC4/transcription elongation factor Spt4